jgi:hypothetical protein
VTAILSYFSTCLASLDSKGNTPYQLMGRTLKSAFKGYLKNWGFICNQWTLCLYFYLSLIHTHTYTRERERERERERSTCIMFVFYIDNWWPYYLKHLFLNYTSSMLLLSILPYVGCFLWESSNTGLTYERIQL